MIPWVQLDTASVPDGGGELRLMQRGGEFSIMAGSIELMNSRLSGSEEALATLACARIEGRSKPAILIGGLGMGFTLRAALWVLGPEASVTVAELVPAVVRWARGPLSALYGSSLDDPPHHGDGGGRRADHHVGAIRVRRYPAGRGQRPGGPDPRLPTTVFTALAGCRTPMRR